MLVRQTLVNTDGVQRTEVENNWLRGRHTNYTNAFAYMCKNMCVITEHGVGRICNVYRAKVSAGSADEAQITAVRRSHVMSAGLVGRASASCPRGNRRAQVCRALPFHSSTRVCHPALPAKSAFGTSVSMGWLHWRRTECARTFLGLTFVTRKDIVSSRWLGDL